MGTILKEEKRNTLINLLRWAEQVQQQSNVYQNQLRQDFKTEFKKKVDYVYDLDCAIDTLCESIEEFMGECKSAVDNLCDRKKRIMTGKIDIANLEDEVIKDAYRGLSQNRNLTWDDLERLKDKLDWDEVSGNTSIQWNEDMIDAFADKINWSVFSKTLDDSMLRTEVIERFEDRWDWQQLSWNYHFNPTYSLIDKYIDRWDWRGLTTFMWDKSGSDFLRRYKEYIPQDLSRHSRLYFLLVTECQNKLVGREL